MKVNYRSMIWLGIALGIAYWFIESSLHTYVFDSGPLTSTLLGEHDPHELWMRLFIFVMFVGFGWIAERSVRAERQLREDALRLNRLLQFVDRVKQGVLRPGASGVSESAPSKTANLIQDWETDADEDKIGLLSRTLQEFSASLDSQFQDLFGLLHLTHEINRGLLLDEALEQAYLTLRSVLPYDRLSLALLEDEGRVIRAQWVHTDSPPIFLGKGYTVSVGEGSLLKVMQSGEPRIINDLPAYLAGHPRSGSTRLLVNEGMRASIACPLISMGRPIGFLFFSSRRADIYRASHVSTLSLIAGHLSVVVEKSSLYQKVLEEKEKSEALLLNVMPLRIADRLRAGEATIVETLPRVGVLFADIVNFTGFARSFPPETVAGVLQKLFTRIDRLCDVYGIEKIKTIGDSYMAISYPDVSENDDYLHRIASFALEILEVTASIHYPDAQPMRVRIGLHDGPVVAGVIGQKKFAYDIWGDAVNVASRMQSSAEPGRIQVSADLFSRLQDAFLFECRGEIDIKGKEPMTTYFLMAKKEVGRDQRT